MRSVRPIPARHALASAALLSALALLASPARADAPPTPGASTPAAAPLPSEQELEEIVVSAPEPRYVAPTLRDRIGRIWAPVYINDRGPFRLVLDTGASRSAVTESVARRLGLPLLPSSTVRLRAVTGTAEVMSVRVDRLVAGDLELPATRLAIVADAFGGAEGVLGVEGLRDKRIDIDFRGDAIRIEHSRAQAARPGVHVVPVKITPGGLISVDARIGGVPVHAIIDTGGQASIGNEALRAALERHYRERAATSQQIVGATLDVQAGTTVATPPVTLGNLSIKGAQVTFGDMYIFEYWHLTREPALLIGMDVLGLLDVLVIDYRKRQLQILLR